MENWSIYLLRNERHALYTGITNQLPRRLDAHCRKLASGAKFTRACTTLELVYSCVVGSKSLALRVELRIKQLSKARKEALVATAPDREQLLATLDLPTSPRPLATDPAASAIRLIVSADDFGASVGRNAGIIEAWQSGIVTSVSLLANGPAFDEAVAAARELQIPLGVHLNLSDYWPLSGPIAGLTTREGAFPGKARLREVLASGAFDQIALRRELTAQVARVTASGLQPDHLDSHQHAMLFPSITSAIIEVARAFKIPSLRLPLPVEAASADPGGALGAELKLYRDLAPAAADVMRNAGLTCPDGLLGAPLLNRLDEARLRRLIESLKPGTWELMTHPGQSAANDPFGGRERESELQALTSPAIKTLIESRGITLITFAELHPPCAS